MTWVKTNNRIQTLSLARMCQGETHPVVISVKIVTGPENMCWFSTTQSRRADVHGPTDLMGSKLSTMAIRETDLWHQGHSKRKDTKKILDLGPLDLRPIGERLAECSAVRAHGRNYSADEA